MLLACPVCSRSYHVESSELDGGRTVICPTCDARWFVDGADEGAPGRRPMSRRSRPGVVAVRMTMPGMLLPCALALLVCAGLAVAARERIVRLLPRTKAVFALAGVPVGGRGLAFSKVAVVGPATDPSSSDLAVAGDLHNVVATRVPIPRLAFEVRDATGHPIMSWTERAPEATLAIGATLHFVSTPHAIPSEARTFVVRLATDAS